ncbi:hypothetical protein K503DRAFT_155134 [Rhizopogon vinicolor AM-OR11-026]|uniref:Uncharacterized protein n=1 Tax=Rhizopogon vinicolor AM-OR11-026 TaxID=1314800 RepID=A0A1B7NF84_9AGAM|nr:hypothetical protein K503DRAFT_155134 [Rhizopogon vinicolor AM-OR11-026]
MYPKCSSCHPRPRSIHVDLHTRTLSHFTLNCVLIEFSLSVQGDCHKDGRKEDDYGSMADTLCDAGIPTDVIGKWFGPREVWDFCRMSIVNRDGSNY